MSAILVSKANLLTASNNENHQSFLPPACTSLRRVILKLVLFDPIVRFKHYYLLKAFITWRKCIPLIQVCRELKNQLQERSSVFDALRESYYRDVICLKHHLEQIAKLGTKMKKLEQYNLFYLIYLIYFFYTYIFFHIISPYLLSNYSFS